MPKVFVVNKSAHDFSEAERYGELVFLTEGRQYHHNANNMSAVLAQKLIHSSPEDYLVLTSLNVLCALAAAIFAQLHNGRLNILLFKNGRYAARELRLDQAIDIELTRAKESEASDD